MLAYNVKGFTYDVGSMPPNMRLMMFEHLRAQRERELEEIKKSGIARKAKIGARK